MLKFICMRLAALSAGYAASLESRLVQTTYTSSQSTFIIADFKKKSTPQLDSQKFYEGPLGEVTLSANLISAPTTLFFMLLYFGQRAFTGGCIADDSLVKHIHLGPQPSLRNFRYSTVKNTSKKSYHSIVHLPWHES